MIIPVIQSILYSFAKVTTTTHGYELDFIGWDNYTNILTIDPEFIRRVTTSLQNMVVQVPFIVLLSLFIALLLNQKFVGRTAARAMFFLPVIIASGLVISIINGDVFSQTIMQSSGASKLMQSDFLNSFLLENGVSEQIVQFITKLVDSIFFLIWKSGIQILLFLAGLQTVPVSMYEAAEIEGSTAWEIFWFVTFPMVSPILLLNVVYTFIDYFTDYSNNVMNYINQLAVNLNIELSAAMAWTYFLILLVIVSVMYLIVNKKVFYQV
jgi:ABC-type sugar transport system permease subunit